MVSGMSDVRTASGWQQLRELAEDLLVESVGLRVAFVENSAEPFGICGRQASLRSLVAEDLDPSKILSGLRCWTLQGAKGALS